jgi:hypothetical protein
MLTHYIAPSAELTRDFVRSRFAAQVWVGGGGVVVWWCK